ncbi:hypothetical protein [Actinacidiphila oryziradicis]|uniref:Uncharacterized protein n=1 Tax=Actinacidiphila oryziradicis TaxID=2571141 RepID=A0A4U0SYN2_9ACTN|nr:hypothetical protein [Actinacidiphila oryziradicis]TKA13177.1 hypothetical protein FCI23_00065 [Actinacidiphila oryziradicis]
MGIFAPKYPSGAEPPKKVSRREAKHQAWRTSLAVNLQNTFDELETESRERSEQFWKDYNRANPDNPSSR